MSTDKINSVLTDSKGRVVNYLRLSITDRCNLNCHYCSGENTKFIPHTNILRYEELLRIAKITHKMGIKKIRVTGGEPFMRKGCMDFLTTLRGHLPDTRLSITTNGLLLEPCIDELHAIRTESVNISLDSMDDTDFRKITGHSGAPIVYANIEKLIARRIHVKINAVIMRNYTPKQIDNFLKIIKELPVDVRFIEFMPMGENTLWNKETFFSAGELKKLFEAKASLIPESKTDNLAGPAKMYKIAGASGRIGFISPISQHFCSSCNRIRLTSDGKLRICLFDDKEINLRKLLRQPKIDDDLIERTIRLALRGKPFGSEILAAKNKTAIAEKGMVGIGG